MTDRTLIKKIRNKKPKTKTKKTKTKTKKKKKIQNTNKPIIGPVVLEMITCIFLENLSKNCFIY